MTRNSFSLATLILIIAVVLFSALKFPPRNNLSWDVFGYYLYLPATFIYHDPLLKDPGFVDEIFEKYDNSSTFYQVSPAPEGGMLIKYTSGLAILYSPFFLGGHIAASLTDHPQDGFSGPYQDAIFYGGLLISIIGLIFLRRISLLYFSDKVSALLLLFLFFGTNYSYNLVFKGAMPHNFLFTLYVILIWVTIKWHRHYSTPTSIALGLVLGLIVLVRPSEIVAVLIPLFWNVTGLRSLVNKWRDILTRRTGSVVWISIMVLLIWAIQFIYWTALSGKPIHYSYDNPGEGFEFLDPFLFEVLFSFRKGWLIYTPMMIFSIIGLYLLYQRNRAIFLSVCLFFLFNLYIISSWSCWWYGGSFGQRALVQSYAIMFIPFGYFLDNIYNGKVWKKVIIVILALFFIMLNLFQIWQLREGIIHESRMTSRYYFNIFGKTETDDNTKDLLMVERPATSMEYFNGERNYNSPEEIYFQDFENPDPDWARHLVDTLSHSGSRAMILHPGHPFSTGLNISFQDLTSGDHVWLRSGVFVYPTSGVDPSQLFLVMTFEHKGKSYKYRTTPLSDLKEMEFNEWNYLSKDYITPEVRSEGDRLSVYVWNNGTGKVIIDDLRVMAYHPAK